MAEEQTTTEAASAPTKIGWDGAEKSDTSAPPEVPDVNLEPPPKRESVLDGASKRCAPFAPLTAAVLLGDACDADDMKFGDPIPSVSFGVFFCQKLGQWPFMIFRTILMSIPPMILITVFSLLPCYGDKDQTDVTAILFGFLVIASATTSAACPLLMASHRNKTPIVIWTVCTFFITCSLNAVAQYLLHKKGKTGKGTITQVFCVPSGIFVSMCFGHMNVTPGWMPKWNTCCGVGRGLNKKVGSCALTLGLAFGSAVILIRFLREDTLLLAESKSPSMIVVRPTIFFVVKKLVYHAFAFFARVRHPVVTKSTNIGVSGMLGVATAILFANTRTWNDMIFFVLGNWFTFLSKLWTLFGSVGATKFKLLAWYSWFMSTGKPHVAPGVTKSHLRGWEIQSQNFGTTFGLVVILGFWPIAKLGFGETSMIFKLLYPTSFSTSFLIVGLANEIIEDNMGQVMIGRLCNNDFGKLYSIIPSAEVQLGLLLNIIMCSVLCSSGWLYRGMKVGPWKEDP